MGIDHRGSDVAVAQKRLDRADIVIRLQEVSCKTVAEGVRRDTLGELCLEDCRPDGPLDMGLVNVVSPLFIGAFDKRQRFLREEPLPYEFPGSVLVLLLKQMIKKHA